MEPGVAQQRPPKPPSLPYASMPSFDSNENQDVINRPQTDLTSSILVQLQSPYEQTTRLDTSSPSHLDDDFHLLSNKSTTHLRSLEAGDKLTDICLRFVGLIIKYQKILFSIGTGNFVSSFFKAIRKFPSRFQKLRSIVTVSWPEQRVWKCYF